MKKIFYIAVFLSVWILSCDKEDISSEQAKSFVKYYTNYPEFLAADLDETGSGGYAVLGTAKLPDGHTDICLLRVDEFGNSVDTARLFGKELDDYGVCIKTLDDGGFAILGSSQNTLTERKEVYFIRTNSNGDTLWTRTMRVFGNVEPRSFEVNADGTFYLVGSRDDYFIKAKEVWLIAINSDGSFPWFEARKLGGARDDEGTHLEILAGGNLAITGKTKSSTFGVTYNQSFVLITNDRGQQIDWIDIRSDYEDEGVNIARVSDNSCLVLTTSKNAGISTIVLYKVDIGARTVQWRKEYTSSGKDAAKDLLINNNNFHILGTRGTNITTNTAISVINTDLNGEQLSRRDFGSGTQLSGSAFIKSVDGGFLILGTNANPEENNTSMALIKMKPDLTF